MASLQLHSPAPISSNTTQQYQLDFCSSLAELRQHHAQIIKLGLSSNNHAIGRIIKFSAISDIRDLNYALKVFHTLPRPDAFVYNTIIRGFSQSNSPEKGFLFYAQMLENSVKPTNFTFPPLIRACCLCNDVIEGKQVHAHVIKLGFSSDGFSQNNLIHMYVNFSKLDDARKVLDSLAKKDDVSWTTLISGYAQHGYVDEAYEVFQAMQWENRKDSSVAWNAMIAAYVQRDRFREAFAVFEKMRAENVKMDKFVAASMLSACSGIGALQQGKWIHRHIQERGIQVDSKLGTTIMDMYCKCGCLDEALAVFHGLKSKGLSSWNCMIGGLAINGKGFEAIELLKKMEEENVTPDYITFVNLLSACAHSGLVDEGKCYFIYMREAYGIEPGMEHYGCMVDLLGRAGLLEEARNVIRNMPMKPDVGVLGALLGACKIHQNVEIGEEIGKELIDLEPKNSGRYVLLANLYADTGKWEDAVSVRMLMNDRGVKKAAGRSSIELEGGVSEFVAAGRTHPEAKEIYGKVGEMLDRIRSAGYVPVHEGAVLDVTCEEEWENSVMYHSEKLAIAFGLLKTKAGETIRITKNLRVCKDCHQVSKLVSKVYDREIVVRDRNRFHHFKGGECSCNDYW